MLMKKKNMIHGETNEVNVNFFNDLTNPPENIRKPNSSYRLIPIHTFVYQGVRNFRFSDIYRGIK